MDDTAYTGNRVSNALGLPEVPGKREVKLLLGQDERHVSK